MGKTGNVCIIYIYIYIPNAGACGGTCAFTWKIVDTLIKNSSRDDRPSIYIESIHGQPGSCRARPVNVDDGLEDIRWIRGLGGEMLPAASYVLLPNLEKVCFCHRRGIDRFCRLFSTHPWTNVFVSDAWPTARHVSPAVL